MKNENTQKKKARLDRLPAENSSIDEWKTWGNRIISKYEEVKNVNMSRVKDLRGLRKELKKKNKVLGYYKIKICELENENEKLANLPFCKIIKAIEQIFKKSD